jgi:predicted alpha/beta-fold hydrolase
LTLPASPTANAAQGTTTQPAGDAAANGNPGIPAGPTNTREWLRAAQPQLEHLLTPRGRRVMLTEQMTDDTSQPCDVFKFFDRPPWTLNSLRWNWNGMVHTGQAVSRAEAIDQPAPTWPGFSTVWIPVGDAVQLHGRIALARDADGNLRQADCIVLIPGFLGDNAVMRTRDLAAGLNRNGFHVLALELRGHGRNEHYFPDTHYTFGVLETQDLIRVSEWLQDEYSCVRDTGLVGFCWGGNHAMLAAWFDGRRPDDPSILPDIAKYFDAPSPRRHYAAGIMAFSPVLRWEELLDRTDIPHEDIWHEPSMYFFQRVIKDRMRREAYPEVSGNLRRLINYEFAHSQFGPSFPVWQAYQFLRFLPYKGRPAGDKLECTRVPVLMVTSINDPFLSGQEMVDLTAQTHNPLVASLILRGGGHIGVGPYNPAYFSSLILNYYDPEHGAAAVCRASRQRP